MSEQVKAKATVYGLGIDSPVFFDEAELDNIPEKGMYHGIYVDKEYLVSIEYIGYFANKYDVFKTTKINGEETYYYTGGSYDRPQIYEGNYQGDYFRWQPSFISQYSDLNNLYNVFRARGIIFQNDIYAQKTLDNVILNTNFGNMTYYQNAPRLVRSKSC